MSASENQLAPLHVFRFHVRFEGDALGGTAAGVVGAAVAAHAAISVAKRSRDKAVEKKAASTNS